jgi:hypothetical protein
LVKLYLAQFISQVVVAVLKEAVRQEQEVLVVEVVELRGRLMEPETPELLIQEVVEALVLEIMLEAQAAPVS